jgi:NAD+ kinase
MKIGIVGQRGNHRAASLVGDLCERLQAEGVDVLVDEATRAEFDREEAWTGGAAPPEPRPPGVPVDRMDGADLVVSVGGDGTFLYVARGAGSSPIMGVNLGEVGFLNAVAPENAVETVLAEVDHIERTGEARTRPLGRLRATGEGVDLPPALNEVVVQGARRGHGGGLNLEVRVDGDGYSSDHADGVLLATTTGSTAYNLSEGGPLLHPSVSAIVVTEMCGAEAMPPLVVDAERTVTVEVEAGDEAVVVSDGRRRASVAPPAELTVERAPDPVYIAGPPLDFFAALGKLD